jgi:hypothetical protein
MYGLPHGFDASFLVGKALDQVSFTGSQLILDFEADISLTVEGAFAHYSEIESEKARVEEVPISSSDLMLLLGAIINEAVGEPDGTLTLRFSNGRTFVCYDNATNFESYQLRHGEKFTIV